MKKIIIPGSIIVLLAIILVWKYSFKDADLSVGNKKPDYSIEASALQSAFELDEATANEKYLNKVVEVSGNIAKVESVENGFNVTMQETDAISGVICGFHNEAASKEDFIIGKKATIKGLCTGYLFDVVLVKCQLEN